MTLGDYDNSNVYYTGSIQFIPCITHFFWLTSVNGIELEGIKYSVRQGSKAILDSGTSLMYVPYNDGVSIIKNIV